MQLNVVLLNSLIKAINHTYDILIIRVEFDMLLLAIRSVSFWGVLGLDLLHKRNRFFCFLVFFGIKYITLYFKPLIVFPFLKMSKKLFIYTYYSSFIKYILYYLFSYYVMQKVQNIIYQAPHHLPILESELKDIFLYFHFLYE